MKPPRKIVVRKLYGKWVVSPNGVGFSTNVQAWDTFEQALGDIHTICIIEQSIISYRERKA